jgi:hypothetical protein
MQLGELLEITFVYACPNRDRHPTPTSRIRRPRRELREIARALAIFSPIRQNQFYGKTGIRPAGR